MYLAVLSGVPQGIVLLVPFSSWCLLMICLYLLLIQIVISLLMIPSLRMHRIETSHSQHLLQSDLNHLFVWCSLWNLSLNKEKCAVLRTSLNPSHSHASNHFPTKSNNQLSSMFLVNEILASPSLPTCPGLNIMTLSACSSAYYSLYLIRRNISTLIPVHIKRLYFVSNVGSIKSIILFASVEA